MIFTTLISIGSFFVNHWEGIASIITGLGSLLGISVLQVKNRAKKIEQETTEVNLIAEAPPEKVEAIKEVKVRRQKKGKYEFIVNNILLIFGIVSLNFIIFQIIKMPIFAKDIEYIKYLLGWMLFANLIVIMMIAGRIVSSVTTFDSFISGLPIVKAFFKK